MQRLRRERLQYEEMERALQKVGFVLSSAHIGCLYE